MSELDESDKHWIRQVTDLSDQLSTKLNELGTLRGEAIGNIAHHLAEVCISSRNIDSRIVPALLVTAVSDSEALAGISHNLMSELDEIRDGIEAMSADITALMNSLNR